MDTVTQISLGAAVGEAVLGKKVGNKAVLWGAVGGLFPDLDVLASPFLSDVQRLTFHRGFSHSLLFAVLVAPLLGWCLARLHRRAAASWRDWSWLMFWAVMTHPLLDAFTNYGTQLFQPFSNVRVAFNTIFIVDPFYTLPLLVSVLVVLFLRRSSDKRRIVNYLGLGLSSLYLAFTAVNKLHINAVFTSALEAEDIPYQRYFTNPTPFNNLLWRGVAETDEGFWEGLYSLLDGHWRITFRFIPKNHHLIRTIGHHHELDDLIWASQGYFCLSRKDGYLYFHDLRFGRTDLGLENDGEYIFSYRIPTTDADGRHHGFERAEPEIRFTDELWERFLRRIRGDS